MHHFKKGCMNILPNLRSYNIVIILCRNQYFRTCLDKMDNKITIVS